MFDNMRVELDTSCQHFTLRFSAACLNVTYQKYQSLQTGPSGGMKLHCKYFKLKAANTGSSFNVKCLLLPGRHLLCVTRLIQFLMKWQSFTPHRLREIKRAVCGNTFWKDTISFDFKIQNFFVQENNLDVGKMDKKKSGRKIEFNKKLLV